MIRRIRKTDGHSNNPRVGVNCQRQPRRPQAEIATVQADDGWEARQAVLDATDAKIESERERRAEFLKYVEQHHRVKAAGFAGFLPGNCSLVDRRDHPEALPAECPCPPIDEWVTNPYGPQPDPAEPATCKHPCAPGGICSACGYPIRKRIKQSPSDAADCSGPPDFGWITPENPRWEEWHAWNDRIIVMTSDGPMVVYVPEDGFPEYEHMDEIAEPDEWKAWSAIPRVQNAQVEPTRGPQKDHE